MVSTSSAVSSAVSCGGDLALRLVPAIMLTAWAGSRAPASTAATSVGAPPRCSRSETTLPMIMSVGERSYSLTTSAASDSSGACTTRCVGVVPSCTATEGMSAGIPASSRPCVSSPSVERPM